MTDRTVVYRLQAETSQFKTQMAAAGASVKKAATDMTAADKEGAKFRQGLDSLGGVAGKVGLVAAAGLGAAVVKAANFDQAMSNVQAATRESASAMESLREAALQAGADTAFSATEAAAGIENLAKAGVSTQEILDGGLTGALDLAAAGGMEVADAAEAAAGAMAQFGLEGDQVPHIADLMAAAAGKAQGEVSDFVFALKQGGTVAAQTGLSIEETTGALAAMAEQSLLGSDAGTSFKTMLAALTPNTKKAADTMAAYNINAFDAQGNFVGMTELAGQLRDGLGDLTDEQRAMALETIFGSDAVRAASIIYDNGAEGIANWTAQVNDAGFAAETAETKLDNLKGDLEELGGALETALIGTGDGSQGMLRGLTQNLTGAINAYNELPQGAQNAAGALLATSAAVGGTIWVGAKLVGGIANTREALENLGLSGPKATAAMKGVAGAAAGLAVLTTAAAAVRSLQEATDEALPGMETLEGRLISMAELPDGFSGSLGKEFDSLAESIDRMTDPSRMDSFADTMQTPFEGLFGEAGSLRQAKAEIDSLDTALASLATSGNAEIAADAIANLADQYGLSEDQVDGLMKSLPQYRDALAGQENDAKLAADAQRDLEGATGSLGDTMQDAAKDVMDFGDVLDGLNEMLSGRADMRSYEAAIDDFTKSLKDNGKTFDINTEKGRNNQAALDNIASTALEVSKNMGQAERQKFLTSAIEDIRTMGKNMGLPKSEINALIELLQRANKANVEPKIDADPAALKQKVEDAKKRLDELGGMKPSPKVDAQTAAAEAKLNNLLAQLREAERDRSSTVTTTFVTNRVVNNSGGPGPQDVNQANGSVLDFFANGGMRENHTAQIAPAGAWRIWAEPETGGEAYIPLAPSKRERSIDIWEEVGARLGVTFERYAAGSAGSKDDKKKKPPRRTLEFESVVDFGPTEQQLAQIADQTAQYYTEQERAQREAEERAEAAARAEQERADAVLEGQQRAWDQATDAAQAQVDAAQAMVDSVQQNMDRIGDAATSAFSGSWFTGEQQTGMWAGGAGTGDWRSQADADIAGLKEREGIIAQLSGLGLTGTALEDLLGNESNEGIQAMIAAGEIDDYAAKFAEREALMASVGAAAGQAGYGADMAAANGHLAQMNSQFAALTAAIEAARPITVLESVSATATAQELARLLSMTGAG